MSKGLEGFIKQNKPAFNDREPEAGLWLKIEKRLPEQTQKNHAKRSFTLGFVLLVAAMVILVMGAGFIFYLQKQQAQPIDFARQQMVYASEVESKRTELKAIAKSDPGLYREFNSEIIKMDSTYKKLNKELVASPDQERVLRAMIRNLQIQTELLNQQLDVIQQYNQTKKQENYGTKSI